MTLFAQGCPHRCAGCHNPDALPFEGGREYTVEKILKLAAANPLLDGLTFSGGEPFSQGSAFGELAAALRACGLTVWTYTGYTFEELSGMPDIEILLHNTDVLVDGRYEDGLKSPLLPFRGSSNQRLIDVKKSLYSGEAVEYILT